MAESSPIPNNGTPNGPELPSDPAKHSTAPEALPAEVQRGLQDIYNRGPEVPAEYDRQVTSAAAQVMAAAGQAASASRASITRQHRRVRLPLAAGLAASLALVVGAWMLLLTIGGFGGPTVNSVTVESRAAKDGTMLIGKASPRDAAAIGSAIKSRDGALRKEGPELGAAYGTGAADADNARGPSELSSKEAKPRFDEPPVPRQQPDPTITAAMSGAAASTAGLSAASEAPPASIAQAAPAQVPAGAAPQATPVPAPAQTPPTPERFSRSETGDAAPPQQAPTAAAEADRPSAPAALAGAPAAVGSGGTTGAALPPTAQRAPGAARRGDESAAKPGAFGANEKAKAEATALDVVDAFRLAWIVNTEAAAANRPAEDRPIGEPWIAFARRDIDADGVVNQADVDALLRNLVKVPAVTPVADDQSSTEIQFDVVLDTGQTPLAGYQIEIIGQGKAVRVVSVGAGSSVAFAEAPKYDGVSLGLALGYGDSRVTTNLDARDANSVQLKSGVNATVLEGSKPLRLAAVSLKPAEQLPRGQVTVARVGWRTADAAEPVMTIKLLAAVDAAGERITPTVKLERVKPILK